MSMNSFILWCYGMASRLTHSNGWTKMKTKAGGTDVHWAGNQEEEEDLKRVVETLRERVSTLRDAVEEQSRLIHEDLDLIETLDKSDESRVSAYDQRAD